MRVLFVCNTYYQIIVAIQLAITEFIDCECEAWISDHTANSNSLVNRLNRHGVFKNVRYIKTKHRWNGRPKKRPKRSTYDIPYYLARARAHIWLPSSRYDIRVEKPYEKIIFYNLSTDFGRIADASKRMGGKGELFRMEEGLLTCNSLHLGGWRRRQGSYDALRSTLGFTSVSNSIQGFYCFLPELCDEQFPIAPLRIPDIMQTREELSAVLRQVFSYEGFPYDQRFIFFGSSQAIDGYPLGEERVVERIAEAFGPENVIVKAHPRDDSNLYGRLGIQVMEGVDVPWEVVQLCENLSDRILLTCTSGAPLAVTALLDDGSQARYLVPDDQNELELDNYLKATESLIPTIDRLHEIGLCPNIRRTSVGQAIYEYGGARG